MQDPNPRLIQHGDASRVPLFLIHDAGGTIFNYYKLGNLGRPVYVIQNPWLKNENGWEGGATAMATEYTRLIKTIKSSGEILVGGWSLGGQIGIDIGRLLAQVPGSKLHVIGNVMIDTLYPQWGPPGTVHADFPVDFVLQHCPPDLKENMLRCMKQSKVDSDQWVQRNSKPDRDRLGPLEALEPPTAVLLHATKYVPVGDAASDAVVMVDQYRNERLGWNLFPHQFIAATWNLPTHHFGLFDKDMVDETTKKVIKACNLLAED